MQIRPLLLADLDEATRVLAAACAFDRAAEVAEEQLFGPAPAGVAAAWGAREGKALIGAARATGDRLRLLAVDPPASGRGVGSTLLAAVERADAHGGVPRLRSLELPGNYLAPGIDVRNADPIGWLEQRGWKPIKQTQNLL